MLRRGEGAGKQNDRYDQVVSEGQVGVADRGVSKDQRHCRDQKGRKPGDDAFFLDCTSNRI